MIELRNLTKRFGPILAVDEISLKVERGEVLGFLGPNGAGKSTTMKMVTGFLPPTSGTASVAGHDVTKEPLAVKRAIGYLPEGAPAYPDMTPESFLKFAAETRGLKGAARKNAMARVRELVHLEGVMRQPIETLSKGYKRRVGLAQALLHDPDVLILDEPTDGLDPNQKHEVRALIRNLAAAGGEGGGGKVIVLSTHILEEVEAVCTRAVIIARGKIVADGTPGELQARSRTHNAVRIRLHTQDNALLDAIRALPSVAAVEAVAEGGEDGVTTHRVIPKGGKAIVGEVGELLAGKGARIDELHVEAGRLDEVFREATRPAPAGASTKEVA